MSISVNLFAKLKQESSACKVKDNLQIYGGQSKAYEYSKRVLIQTKSNL